MASNNLYLTDEQYLNVLNKQLERLKTKRIPLDLIDSNAQGDKDTQATWGLCSREAELWPKETHAFENRTNDKDVFVRLDTREVIKHETVYGIKYRLDNHLCPMDIGWKTGANYGRMGCYYRCRIFNPKELFPFPTLDEAIELYEAQLLTQNSN